MLAEFARKIEFTTVMLVSAMLLPEITMAPPVVAWFPLKFDPLIDKETCVTGWN